MPPAPTARCASHPTRPAVAGRGATLRCHTCERERKRSRRAAVHDARVQRVYGLAPGDYARLYAHQGGKCRICRRATGRTRSLSVDHNHATGEVRGLLCRPCNNLIGHLRDDPEAFFRAGLYLIHPPAREVLEPPSVNASNSDIWDG